MWLHPSPLKPLALCQVTSDYRELRESGFESIMSLTFFRAPVPLITCLPFIEVPLQKVGGVFSNITMLNEGVSDSNILYLR